MHSQKTTVKLHVRVTHSKPQPSQVPKSAFTHAIAHMSFCRGEVKVWSMQDVTVALAICNQQQCAYHKDDVMISLFSDIAILMSPVAPLIHPVPALQTHPKFE